MQEESELRLFLSVDIAGSTNLKNIKNHQALLQIHRERQSVINQVIPLEEEQKRTKILTRSILTHLSEEDLDWASVISATFNDFNQLFRKLYILCCSTEDKDIQKNLFYPWKALGDELIYSFPVKRRKDIHDYVCCFLAALRKVDNKLKERNFIRLKGSAWVAGFPVRNRKVFLPMPEVVVTQGSANAIYPYPRLDFWGPDMDIGFRIGRCTWPGFIVLSMDLAQLLGEHTYHQQILLKFLGWESLKGVWSDRPYPIFWASLPEDYEYQTKYQEYEHGSEMQSDFLKKWIDKKNEPKEAKHFVELITQIRNQLPGNLGAVRPYISQEGTENDKIPEEHAQILAILQEVSKHPTGIGGHQHQEADTHDAPTIDEEKIKLEITEMFFKD